MSWVNKGAPSKPSWPLVLYPYSSRRRETVWAYCSFNGLELITIFSATQEADPNIKARTNSMADTIVITYF